MIILIVAVFLCPTGPLVHCRDDRVAHVLQLLELLLVVLLPSVRVAVEEADKWKASYERLGRGSLEEDIALCTLTDELVVALALGGSPLAFDAQSFSATRIVVRAAASRMDVTLECALRDKKMLVAERIEVWAVRAFLHPGVWSALKELNGSATATE
ncbi:hypothetical protein ACP70R_037494 [Stipagrostis hirtigluma subsp. patula]